MNSRAHLVSTLCAGLLWLSALPAGAASVVELRVGQHAEFTRVVFELDAAAGYRIDRGVAEDGSALLLVTLDAALAESAPRRVRSASSLLRQVRVEPQGPRSLATIELRGDRRPVKERILQGPPRIVLDVLGSDQNIALVSPKRSPKPPKAEPVQAAAEPPRASPEPSGSRSRPPAEPSKPAAVAPEQVGTAAQARPVPPRARPGPQPAEVVEKPSAGPGQTQVARTVVDEPPQPRTDSSPLKPARPEEAVAPSKASPEPTAQQRAAPPSGPPVPRNPQAESAARDALKRRLAALDEAAKAESESEARQADSSEGAGGLSWTMIGAGAGAAVVALLVALMLVRRRTLPRDLDVTALDGADEEPPSLLDTVPEEPLGSTEPDSEPLSRRGPSPSAEAEPPLSAPGLFDEPEKGDTAMETQAHEFSSPGAGAAPGRDLGRLVAQLEQRMGQLEAKLEESNAARERLERQVAAQSEELRVQRAAIARTQRALRGLSRTDEDQATEPALRD